MVGVAFPFPVAVCDVGGTNCRIALQDAPDAPLLSCPPLLTGDFPGLARAIEVGTEKAPIRPRSVIVCGAGPVIGRHLKLTNAPWVLDGPQIAEALGLDNGLLLNDFEAQALSLPALRPDWTRIIGHPLPVDAGPQAILGPGTGLGIACLVTHEGRAIALASEACHIGFAPETPEEEAFWPHLERAHGRITTESVLSGAGLARLHRARLAAQGSPSSPSIQAADVVGIALVSPGSEEARTIAAYWTLIGRFAGDIAISFKATGGVTLAGGILPRIAGLVDPDAFRTAFEAKDPVAALARQIPTRLIVQPDTVLDGMAAIASHPELYAIDYANRQWRG
jgi:glucokinase